MPPTRIGLAPARLRHDLLPKLAAEYNPRVMEALVRLGHLAGSAQRQFDRRLSRLAQAATVEVGPLAVVLLVHRLRVLPPGVRAEVIRWVWKRAGWGEGGMTLTHWYELAALVGRERGRLTLPGGIDAWRSDDILLGACASHRGDTPGPVPRFVSRARLRVLG